MTTLVKQNSTHFFIYSKRINLSKKNPGAVCPGFFITLYMFLYRSYASTFSSSLVTHQLIYHAHSAV
jgi:hypothetical protein